MTMLAAIFSAVSIAIGTGPGMNCAPRGRHRRRPHRRAILYPLRDARDLRADGWFETSETKTGYILPQAPSTSSSKITDIKITDILT
jgi:hypothetical protein